MFVCLEQKINSMITIQQHFLNGLGPNCTICLFAVGTRLRTLAIQDR